MSLDPSASYAAAQTAIDAAFDLIKSKAVGPTKIPKEVAKKAKTEQEKDGEQARWLRYLLALFILVILAIELWALYHLIIWQGTGRHYAGSDFKLDEKVFGIVILGVLLQTFFGLRTMITHLFPKGHAYASSGREK